MALPSWAPFAAVGFVGLVAYGVYLESQAEDEGKRTFVFETTPASRKAYASEKRRASLAERSTKRRDLSEDRKDALAQAALSKARQKAGREQIRADRLWAQMEKARTKTRGRELMEKAATATGNVNNLNDIAGRIEAGNYTPGELRELMASGTLRLRG